MKVKEKKEKTEVVLSKNNNIDSSETYFCPKV